MQSKSLAIKVFEAISWPMLLLPSCAAPHQHFFPLPGCTDVSGSRIQPKHQLALATCFALSSFSLSVFMPALARFFITRFASGSKASLKSHPLFRLNILQVRLHESALPREKTISILGISGGSFPSVAKNAFCRRSRTTILTFLFPRSGTETVSRYSFPTSPCERLFADSMASTPGNQSPKRSMFVT